MTKYWFRKRRGLFAKSESPLGFDLGWGWVPVSWEGWALTIVMVAVILLYVSVYKAVNLTDNIDLPKTLIFSGIVLVLFALIANSRTRK